MPKVIFTAAFEFKPSPNVWQTYCASADPQLVTTPCAVAAVAAGKAVVVAEVRDAPDGQSEVSETAAGGDTKPLPDSNLLPELPAEPEGPVQ